MADREVVTETILCHRCLYRNDCRGLNGPFTEDLYEGETDNKCDEFKRDMDVLYRPSKESFMVANWMSSKPGIGIPKDVFMGRRNAGEKESEGS